MANDQIYFPLISLGQISLLVESLCHSLKQAL